MKENYRSSVDKKTNGKSDFKLEFSDGDEESVLVFEHDPSPKIKKSNSNGAQNQTVPEKEFSVPEKYTVNKRYNTSRMIIDEPPSVHTTYMPKFTEASEHYTVTEEVRPRRKFSAKKVDDVHKSEEENGIDPTTESVENNDVEGVQVVTSGNSADEKQEVQSTVFKFDKNTKNTAEDVDADDSEHGFVVVSAEPSADDVFANSDLSYVDMAPTGARNSSVREETAYAEPVIEENVELEFDAKEESQPLKEKSEYKLPDPEPIVIEVPTPGTMPLETKSVPGIPEEAPSGIGDATSSKRKPGVSEYTSFSQRDAFKDRFLDAILATKVRLVASIVLLVVALLLENLSLFGVNVPTLIGLSGARTDLAMLDIQLVVALFLLALPEVIIAFKRLLWGRPTPELYLPISFAVAVVYYSVIIIYKTEKYPLFGLIFGILTVSAITATLFKHIADFTNFKTISTNTEKRIVDRKLTRTLQSEHFAVDGKIESYKSKTARIFRVSFISNFFKRAGKCSENSSNVLLILASVFGVSFVGGVIAYFIPGGISSAIITFASVFMIGIPAFTVLTHKLPYYHSAVEAMIENSAVIGETTLYDYSDVDVVTFEDTEIFGADDVNIQRIMLYGKNENLAKATQQMSALFSVVGGPLDRLFSSSVEQSYTRAINVEIEDDGIYGEVFEKSVMAGSRDFMKRHKVRIPDDAAKDSTFGATQVMYVAEEGEVYAKFYIRYSLSDEFSMAFPSLFEEQMVPLIYTRDPNVNNELLRTLTAGNDFIRVLKKKNLNINEDKVYRCVNAGLVTLGDKINVVNMLLMSKKYVRFQSRMMVSEISAMAVGSVLAIVLALGSMMAVPSALLALWQAAWSVALFFISKRALRERRNKKTRRK